MKRGPVEVVEWKTSKIPIYAGLHHGKKSFLIAYYADGKRKRERFHSIEEARAEAKEKIGGLTKGTAHVGTFSAREVAVVTDAVEILRGINVPLSKVVRDYAEAYKILGDKPEIVEAAKHLAAFREEQKKKADLVPIKLPDLVQKFMADIRERKKSRRYTLDMQARLAQASKAFAGLVADIKVEDIDSWLESMKGVSGRTKNNYRAALGTLFAFARKKGHLSRGQQTEVEFSVRYDDAGGEIGFYSPTQLSTLLTNIERRLVPFVAIGAFAGLRSAEICRLTWDDIRWGHGDIELKKSKAKTASRRLAPLLPVLREWLWPFRKRSGPVLEGVHDEFALATQFKKAVDAVTDSARKPLVKIVHNGLRHSFITYRVATEKSAAAVALEAGNSPKMIFEHYRALATEEEGREWFSVMPAQSGKVVSIAS